MLEVIGSFLRVMAGTFVVLGLWYVFLGIVRRNSGCRNPNKDVLDFMLNGCGGGCQGRGGCHADGHSDSKLHGFEAHNETL